MKSLWRVITQRLEYKILSLILIVLVISFFGIYSIMSSQERSKLIDSHIEKSKLLADTIHETLDRDMMAFGADGVRFLMSDVKKLEGIERIQIVRGNAPYVGEGRGQDEAFMDFKTLDDVKKRITLALYRMEWERQHPDESPNIAPGTENQEFKDLFEQTIMRLEEDNLHRKKEDKALKTGLLDSTYFEEIDGVEVLTYLRPLPNFPRCALCHGVDHSLRGMLMISTSTQRIDAALLETRQFLITASVVTVLILILLMRLLMRRVVLVPVNTIVSRVKDIAEGGGDLTNRIKADYKDEIGEVARWFNVFIEKLHHIISQVAQTSRQVKGASKEIRTGTDKIMEGANVQIHAIEATSACIQALDASSRQVAESAESLTGMAQESAVAILQMGSSIDEIARSAAALSSSVEDTTASILEMSSSVKEIDENVENLNSGAESTTVAMRQMDAAIQQIRSNVHQTVQLSKGVTEDAERGRKATNLTIEGITKIQEYSQEVHNVINNLKNRTESIGKILNVIDEVAEQTNLLALNATIIAAQSGEHGRGFAVVAQEIKELADRTRISTTEIQEIIQDLQNESKNAVQAINRSTRSVEEGVRLSGEAGDALIKILESSKQSTDRIQEIARTTDEQTASVKNVSESMQGIMGMVKQIARATHEQSKGSELIIGSTEQIKEIASKVRSATQEQSIGNKQITEIVEGVTQRVKDIAKATGKQADESAKILNAINEIKAVVEQNVDTIGKAGKSAEEMIKQSTQLSNEINKFKL